MRRILWRWDSSWRETARLYAIALGVAAIAAAVNGLLAALGVRSLLPLVVIAVVGVPAALVVWQVVESFVAAETPATVTQISFVAVSHGVGPVAVGDVSAQTPWLAAAGVTVVLLLGRQETHIGPVVANNTSTESHVIVRAVS